MNTDIAIALLNYARIESMKRGDVMIVEDGDDVWSIRTVVGEPGWRASFRTRIDRATGLDCYMSDESVPLELTDKEKKLWDGLFHDGANHVDEFWIGENKLVHAQYEHELMMGLVINASEPWWHFVALGLRRPNESNDDEDPYTIANP